MSLYYEPDPANENDPPLLPPILTPIPVVKDVEVFAKAIAVAGKSETGTVLYSENPEYVEVAIILSPEVPKIKCNQMLYILMVAAGDAIGALAPPEVAVTYAFPGFIFLNRGEAGFVKIEVAPSTDDKSIPDWMVVGLKLRLNNNIEAIGFNFAQYIDEISDNIDIAYNIKINNFRGKQSLQLFIVDIMLH